MWIALLLAAFAQDLTEPEARALKRVKGAVERAWVYRGPAESTPPAGRQYVAADLLLWRYTDRLDLQNVEAFDPDSQEAAGNPQFACLGPNDMPAPCDGAEERELRVRLVWSVPASATGIHLSLWGKKLGKAEIEPSGPTLPRTQVRDATTEPVE